MQKGSSHRRYKIWYGGFFVFFFNYLLWRRQSCTAEDIGRTESRSFQVILITSIHKEICLISHLHRSYLFCLDHNHQLSEVSIYFYNLGNFLGW